MYVLSDYIKEHFTEDATGWYAFGRETISIANRVTDICSNSLFVGCNDFSKMDGRKTYITRVFNFLVMLRFFNETYHTQITRSLEGKRYTRTAFQFRKYGLDLQLFYNSLESQGSGLPDTSTFNSLDNAFCIFLAYYQMHQNYDVAWRNLTTKSIIGGDDSVVGDLSPDAIVGACRKVGHAVKATTFQRGEPGVNMLARIYGPAVWYGDNNSMCDFIRTLGKFHLSGNLPPDVTAMIKFEQKMTSLSINDSNTPVIRDLIAKWIAVGGTPVKQLDPRIASYLSLIGGRYPNEGIDTWMPMLYPEVDDWSSEMQRVLEAVHNPMDLLELTPFHTLDTIKFGDNANAAVLVRNGEAIIIPGPETVIEPNTNASAKAPKNRHPKLTEYTKVAKGLKAEMYEVQHLDKKDTSYRTDFLPKKNNKGDQHTPQDLTGKPPTAVDTIKTATKPINKKATTATTKIAKANTGKNANKAKADATPNVSVSKTENKSTKPDSAPKSENVSSHTLAIPPKAQVKKTSTTVLKPQNVKVDNSESNASKAPVVTTKPIAVAVKDVDTIKSPVIPKKKKRRRKRKNNKDKSPSLTVPPLVGAPDKE